MYLVRLNQLKYRTTHGLYSQEKLIDNVFEVSLEVETDRLLSKCNNIEDLIDYVSLKDVCDKYMTKHFNLLEDILAHISSDVLEMYPDSKGYVSIKKCPPPFGGDVASAEVILKF